MNLDEAVDLVLFAFKNGEQGDLFVQKSPASTIEDLAKAIKKLFKSNVDIKVIGTRHGEKAHETLMTREERLKSDSLGNYFRVSADNRDLNYEKYFSEGNSGIDSVVEYTSDNTERLNVDGIIEKLMTVEYIKEAIVGKVIETK